MLHNVLAHPGIEPGDPSLASADVSVFVTSQAAGEALRRVFIDVLARSPNLQSLNKAAALNARLAIY